MDSASATYLWQAEIEMLLKPTSLLFDATVNIYLLKPVQDILLKKVVVEES